MTGAAGTSAAGTQTSCGTRLVVERCLARLVHRRRGHVTAFGGRGVLLRDNKTRGVSDIGVSLAPNSCACLPDCSHGRVDPLWRISQLTIMGAEPESSIMITVAESCLLQAHSPLCGTTQTSEGTCAGRAPSSEMVSFDHRLISTTPENTNMKGLSSYFGGDKLVTEKVAEQDTERTTHFRCS